MLSDSQILRLLALCEERLGSPLKLIRGNLCSKQWLGAVWELVVIDAATQLGSVTYEARSPGRGSPDILLELRSGQRIWIEAAFLCKEREIPSQGGKDIRRVEDHPAYRPLKEKAWKAKIASLSEPYLVLLGTDRVLEIQSRTSNGLNAEHAIRKVFRDSSSVTAVVLLSMLFSAEVFKGFVRRVSAHLYANPSARSRLSFGDLESLNRLDFQRWNFDLLTHREPERKALKEALRAPNKLSDGASDSSEPYSDHKLPYPCWSCVWWFHRLRIAKLGPKYYLFDGREMLDVSGETAQQLAETASFLFQPYPGDVIGPEGVQPHPDLGVAADLQKWTLELPG